MNALVGSVATLPCAARRVRDKQHTRRRAATVSARAAKEDEDVCQFEQQPKGVADFAGNVRRAAAAASAAAVIAGCLPLDARAEIPPELTRPDPIFTENFTVKFAGIEFDHKVRAAVRVDTTTA